MPHIVQLGSQQQIHPARGSLPHDMNTMSRAGREHALLDPAAINNNLAARCSADTEECTRNEIGLIDKGSADANLECKDGDMNEKTQMHAKEAFGPRDSHFAKKERFCSPQGPSFRQTSFCPKKTRYSSHHYKLELDHSARTDCQHAVLFQEPLPHTRIAIISTCFLVATASAFYETSKPDLPHHTYVNHNRVLSLLELLQHLVFSIGPLCIFTIATAIIYHLNLHHRFQDFFVLVGLISGVVVGMAKYRDLQDAIFRVMPWGVIAALGTSMAAHVAWELRSGVRENYHMMV